MNEPLDAPSDEPLDHLLAQLCSGDMEAAERVFLAYEPYLRQAVRRHLSASLRAKFDSTDIVQSSWADVLRGFREAGWRFVDADHLRGFLFVATRNRLIDRIRQHQKAVDLEEPLGEGDHEQGRDAEEQWPDEPAEPASHHEGLHRVAIEVDAVREVVVDTRSPDTTE